MAITTTSVLADTIPTVIAEARFTSQHAPVIARKCWNIRKKKHEGKTVNVPYWGYVSAVALTEGVDMASPTSMADTNVPITPAEVGAQILLTWKLARDNQEDVIRAAGRILGEAFVAKQEQDLAGQFADGIIALGASGVMTLGQIAAAWSLLKGNAMSTGGPAPEPYGLFHHPFTLLDVVDVLTPLAPWHAATVATYGVTGGQGALSDRVIKEGQPAMGRLFGMDVFASGNFAINSNVVQGGVMAMGEGGSLILAISEDWEINPDDDPSLRATELNVVGEYGVGEYLAGWIIECINDATTPA